MAVDHTDIQLGFQYICEAKQELANVRAAIDVAEAKISKIEVVIKSIQEMTNGR